ncbi:GapR family DNA-binding domain-containing protein [Candidatus Bandiella euplotis]|nr:GapR family DNA-binding domain-containing protein [Candidatus Bandiella woodruffii]
MPVLKLRKMDNDERLRQEEELETYKATIGMK